MSDLDATHSSDAARALGAPGVERAAIDPSRSTLVELSAAAAAGDERAFNALHHRVGAGLRRLLLKRSGGRADLVDDLMQTTWTSVWNALRQGKYDPNRAAITTFVYAVGNNAWLTHLRKFSREQGYAGSGRQSEGAPGSRRSTTDPETRPDATPPVEDAATAAETIDIVRACLREQGVAGLTDQERLIVRSIAAGESDRGLARRLGISCSTVNVRKHSGFEKIRRHLEARLGGGGPRPGGDMGVVGGVVGSVKPSQQTLKDNTSKGTTPINGASSGSGRDAS